MTPPLIRLPHGSDAPSILVRLTWLGGVPAIDVGEADEEAMVEIRQWLHDVLWAVTTEDAQRADRLFGLPSPEPSAISETR